MSPLSPPIGGATIGPATIAPAAVAADLSPGVAYARALSGEPCLVVGDDGGRTELQAHRWLAEADASDRELFVAPCSGPTLDIGCGPGRLLVALRQRGVPAHGIDVSHQAVAHARARGASAALADIFSPSSVDGRWSHVLLADGNVGIGGRPARLLARVRALLAPGGSAHVELDNGAGATEGVTSRRVRLHVGGSRSTWFRWATVSADGIGRLAEEAGMRLLRVDRHAGRDVAVLRPVG